MQAQDLTDFDMKIEGFLGRQESLRNYMYCILLHVVEMA